MSHAHVRGELNPLLDTQESKGRLFSAQPGELAAPHPSDHTQAGGVCVCVCVVPSSSSSSSAQGLCGEPGCWQPSGIRGPFGDRAGRGRGQRQAALLTLIRCRESTG